MRITLYDILPEHLYLVPRVFAAIPSDSKGAIVGLTAAHFNQVKFYIKRTKSGFSISYTGAAP